MALTIEEFNQQLATNPNIELEEEISEEKMRKLIFGKKEDSRFRQFLWNKFWYPRLLRCHKCPQCGKMVSKKTYSEVLKTFPINVEYEHYKKDSDGEYQLLNVNNVVEEGESGRLITIIECPHCGYQSIKEGEFCDGDHTERREHN